MRRLSRLGRNLSRPLSNNRGVAMMIAVASLMLIMYFAMEVSYDSNVEYLVNAQSLNRVKAYYAAKSGLQLSLLRIKIYQQAKEALGPTMGDSPVLEQIWKFPFAWPLPIPEELNAVDKDSFQKLTKESIMDASYFVTIEDEGSKIDLNDLNSPSQTLKDVTKQQLLNIFEQKKKDDAEFAREYGNFRFDELINNIADWMSPKAESLNGGPKTAKYAELNAEAQSDYFPPNRGFRTLAELYLIPEMTDAFYALLEPRVTIYGMKGINPNLATKEVLLSLDPGMTAEAVTAILKRRETPADEGGGPFKCEEGGGSADFWKFVQEQNVPLQGDPSKVPLICDAVMNFKIRSNGEFAGASREITVIVMDLNRATAKLKTLVDKDKQAQAPQTPQTPEQQRQQQQQQNQKTPLPKGPPRIVYWNEK